MILSNSFDLCQLTQNSQFWLIWRRFLLSISCLKFSLYIYFDHLEIERIIAWRLQRIKKNAKYPWHLGLSVFVFHPYFISAWQKSSELIKLSSAWSLQQDWWVDFMISSLQCIARSGNIITNNRPTRAGNHFYQKIVSFRSSSFCNQ